MTSHATPHAAIRASERYGLHPSDADWTRLVLDITDAVIGDNHKAMLVKRFSRSCELWAVRLSGEAVLAIYNPVTAVVVTVLEVGMERWRG